MAKVVIWIVIIVVAVPVALVTYVAFDLYVYRPAKHSWNVSRMDAENDQVWEEAVARVVTVEVELGTSQRVRTLKTDVVCYEGYFAKAWDLKAGGLRTGISAKSIGFEAFQAEFPPGATLDIDFTFLCRDVFRMESNELPLKLVRNGIYIVAPELSLYCQFSNTGRSGRSTSNALQTDVGWVGYPTIVAIKMRPLRTLATRSDMGSSEVPSAPLGFSRRWDRATRFHKSHWNVEKTCWTDNQRRCSETLTSYCGKNLR